MSLSDCRGSVWAFQQLMRAVREDIYEGRRLGALQVYRGPASATELQQLRRERYGFSRRLRAFTRKDQ